MRVLIHVPTCIALLQKHGKKIKCQNNDAFIKYNMSGTLSHRNAVDEQYDPSATNVVDIVTF